MNNNGNKRKKHLESRILTSKGYALLDYEIIELFLYAVHRKIHARITAIAMTKRLALACNTLSIELVVM